MPLPPPQTLIRDGMTYEEIVATLLATGSDSLDARQFAAITTGRRDGDVAPSRPKRTVRIGAGKKRGK